MATKNQQRAETRRYPGMTEWTNPTDRVVTLKIHTGPPGTGLDGLAKNPGHEKYEIEPGESMLIPSKYDDAIQFCDASGVVQHGLAPQLIKNGVAAEVHESLDPAEQARKTAEAKSELAAQSKAVADSALLVADAERRKAEAEAAKAESASKEAAKSKAEAAKAEGASK